MPRGGLSNRSQWGSVVSEPATGLDFLGSDFGSGGLGTGLSAPVMPALAPVDTAIVPATSSGAAKPRPAASSGSAGLWARVAVVARCSPPAAAKAAGIVVDTAAGVSSSVPSVLELPPPDVFQGELAGAVHSWAPVMVTRMKNRVISPLGRGSAALATFSEQMTQTQARARAALRLRDEAQTQTQLAEKSGEPNAIAAAGRSRAAAEAAAIGVVRDADASAAALIATLAEAGAVFDATVGHPESGGSAALATHRERGVGAGASSRGGGAPIGGGAGGSSGSRGAPPAAGAGSDSSPSGENASAVDNGGGNGGAAREVGTVSPAPVTKVATEVSPSALISALTRAGESLSTTDPAAAAVIAALIKASETLHITDPAAFITSLAKAGQALHAANPTALTTALAKAGATLSVTDPAGAAVIASFIRAEDAVGTADPAAATDAALQPSTGSGDYALHERPSDSTPLSPQSDTSHRPVLFSGEPSPLDPHDSDVSIKSDAPIT
jgi:hypothetical protein